ncbi:diguanylate cyclase domain-containing protein [Roseateles sp. LYH14W]|uniref:diguanylate cyclase n=1 Tax=Pelomonas parva TaxID=3299032 RepID=A0ABW7F1B0_9BURK
MQSILIVDDNVPLIQVLAPMLAGQARVRFATSGAAALQQMRRDPPDLVLLDAEMPDMDGYQVCRAMQEDPELHPIPVIFVTGHDDLDAELRGLACGAVDFISKPVREPLLAARVSTQLRVKRLTDELRRLAALDALTSLHNRGSFDQRLSQEWQRSVRTGEPLALVLLDVDHFKRFNDHYGHPAGDACLRAVAQAIDAQARRPGDMAARVGGEEFAVLLPNTTAAGAREVAQSIRHAISGLQIPHAASLHAAHVTASLGLAVCVPKDAAPGTDEQALIGAADRALYEAKQAGRDRVCAAPLLQGRLADAVTCCEA